MKWLVPIYISEQGLFTGVFHSYEEVAKFIIDNSYNYVKVADHSYNTIIDIPIPDNLLGRTPDVVKDICEQLLPYAKQGNIFWAEENDYTTGEKRRVAMAIFFNEGSDD